MLFYLLCLILSGGKQEDDGVVTLSRERCKCNYTL